MDKSWNFGLETEPVKTLDDPCPDGWRVPTDTELDNLIRNYSDWTRNGGQYGYWFSGSVPYSKDVNRVFLSAAGEHGYSTETALGRNDSGYYWSSSVRVNEAWYISFSRGDVSHNTYPRAGGRSVRCVKE